VNQIKRLFHECLQLCQNTQVSLEGLQGTECLTFYFLIGIQLVDRRQSFQLRGEIDEITTRQSRGECFATLKQQFSKLIKTFNKEHLIMSIILTCCSLFPSWWILTSLTRPDGGSNKTSKKNMSEDMNISVPGGPDIMNFNLYNEIIVYI